MGFPSISSQSRYDFTIYSQQVHQIQDMLIQLVQFPPERPIHHNLQLSELLWSAKQSLATYIHKKTQVDALLRKTQSLTTSQKLRTSSFPFL